MRTKMIAAAVGLCAVGVLLAGCPARGPHGPSKAATYRPGIITASDAEVPAMAAARGPHGPPKPSAAYHSERMARPAAEASAGAASEGPPPG